MTHNDTHRRQVGTAPRRSVRRWSWLVGVDSGGVRHSGAPGVAHLLLCILILLHTYTCSLVLPVSSSSSPSSPLRSSARVPVPPPTIGTWMLLHPESDPIHGSPPARCDHTTTSMEGRAIRHNAKIPFAGDGQPPASDPYATHLYVLAGISHDSLELNDSWILDASSDPPRWSFQNYSTDSDNFLPRFGHAVSFLPNGLHSDDIGLTALIWGGTSASLYLDDVSTFNFATRRMRTIIAHTEDRLNRGGPFARAYSEWYPLPQGFQTGNINASVDSGTLLMMGGSGSSDGIRFSEYDSTWDDEWFFHLPETRWEHFGSYECRANSTTCTDAKALYQYAEPLRQAFVNSTLNLTRIVRPAEALPALQMLLDTLNSVNHSLTETLSSVSPESPQFLNQQGACTTACSLPKYIVTSDTIYPPDLEGYRFVEMDDKLYVFGGYKCSNLGVQQVGGDLCFQQSVWILDYATMKWSEITRPDSDSRYADFAKYWPSPRAYAVAEAHPTKRQIIFHGGAFQADTYIFSTELLQYLPVDIRGIIPSPAWSSGSGMIGQDMYLFGGCAGSIMSAQLLSFRIDLKVEPNNCFASGTGLTTSIAGIRTDVLVQTRESRLTNRTTFRSNVETTFLSSTNQTLIWGRNTSYGAGLTLSAQLVTAASASSEQLGLIPCRVVDLGLGLYHISYSVEQGTLFKLFISLDESQIPGSPFTVQLQPRDVAAPSSSTVTSYGYGHQIAEKGASATVVIQMRDQFGNAIYDNRYLKNGNAITSDELFHMSQQQVWIGRMNETIILTAQLGPSLDQLQTIPIRIVHNSKGGTFNLTYDVPSDLDQFLLIISINNATLIGSPFLVEGLNSVGVTNGFKIAFYVLAGIVITICLILSGLVYRYRSIPIIRTASPNFLHILIFGSIMCSMSVIFLTLDQHDFGCRGFHSFLSIGLVVSMSALLAKSHRVMKIFTASKLRVKAGLDDAHLLIPTVTAIMIMVTLNVLWIAIDPLSSVTEPALNHPEVLTWQFCQGGSNVYVWLGLVIGYCAIILAYGVYLAVKTSDVPGSFNESKLIAASVYNIFFCSIIVVPLMFFIGASSDFIAARLVLQASIILWCSAFNVTSIIGPKLLIHFRGGGLESGLAAGASSTAGNAAGVSYLRPASPMSAAPTGPGGKRASIALPMTSNGPRASIAIPRSNTQSNLHVGAVGDGKSPGGRTHRAPSFVATKRVSIMTPADMASDTLASSTASKAAVRPPDPKLAALAAQLDRLAETSNKESDHEDDDDQSKDNNNNKPSTNASDLPSKKAAPPSSVSDGVGVTGAVGRSEPKSEKSPQSSFGADRSPDSIPPPLTIYRSASTDGITVELVSPIASPSVSPSPSYVASSSVDPPQESARDFVSRLQARRRLHTVSGATSPAAATTVTGTHVSVTVASLTPTPRRTTPTVKIHASTNQNNNNNNNSNTDANTTIAASNDATP